MHHQIPSNQSFRVLYIMWFRKYRLHKKNQLTGVTEPSSDLDLMVLCAWHCGNDAPARQLRALWNVSETTACSQRKQTGWTQTDAWTMWFQYTPSVLVSNFVMERGGGGGGGDTKIFINGPDTPNEKEQQLHNVKSHGDREILSRKVLQ